MADRIEKKTTQVRWTEQSSFIVERDIMVSAYALRRLMETKKLSDRVARSHVAIIKHLSKGPMPDAWNRGEYWELYDLETSQQSQLGLAQYCNQLIHSYVWSTSANEHTGLFDGVYAVSEKDRTKHLFFISAKAIVSVCRKAGGEDIKSYQMDATSESLRYISRTAAFGPNESPWGA